MTKLEKELSATMDSSGELLASLAAMQDFRAAFGSPAELTLFGIYRAQGMNHFAAMNKVMSVIDSRFKSRES